MSNVPVPLLDVQPVLTFTASCFCGWLSDGHGTEDEGKDATLSHLLHPVCGVCVEPLASCWPEANNVPASAAAVVDGQTYCPDCAQHYV